MSPIGASFPFYPATGSAGLFESVYTKLAAVTSDIRCILVTNWGERVMLTQFGCNLIEFLFSPLRGPQLGGAIERRIRDQMGRWLPGVKVQEVTVLTPEEDPTLSDNTVRVRMKFFVGSRIGSLDEVIGG